MSGLGVGVDVGGSGMRILVQDEEETRESHDRGPVRKIDGRMDADALVARIHALLTHLIGERPIDRLAIGLTGMPGLVDERTLAAAIATACDPATIIVASDALTTHIGALEGAAGTVVAAGTGVIALGTDHAQIWNQADGWGHLLGDLGGGAWVGAQGLGLALQARDGRRAGSRLLLELAMEKYGSTDALLGAVYGGGMPAHELAAFAPVVAEAALRGDGAARGVWDAAGRHLAAAAVAASHGLPPVVSWGGGLFSAGELLLEPFRQELGVLRPGAEVAPPAGRAVEGAMRLAVEVPIDGCEERFLRSFTYREVAAEATARGQRH